MPYLILFIGLALGIFALYRFFLNANVKEIKAFALAVFAGVTVLALIIMALTGKLAAALMLLVALLPFALPLLKKKEEPTETPTPENSGPMTRKEALEVLNLPEGASTEDINTAYKRLMMKVHPDQEGSDWLAAKLNQARDILLSH